MNPEKEAAYTIRHAEAGDLDTILAIYAHARDFMRENGNPRQWNTVWPPRALVEEDIARQRNYVCTDEDGRILAVFVYLFGGNAEPGYLGIEDGGWSKDAPYGVVHRIATAENSRGVGSFCIRWAYAQSGYLRIDTHPDNTVMQNALEKLGFTKRGIIHVIEDHDPRFAYEKC